MSKSRIEELYELIQHHADLYYNEDAPEITDANALVPFPNILRDY